MRRLVADLLLLARADAGREPPRRPVDLVRASSPTRRPSSSRSRATTRSRSRRPPAPEVDGVRDELHRLVLNLMENALRHTDPGTAVEATRRAPQRRGRARRRGRRAGHPGRAADKVFERFFRGHGDRSGSSGLGLSIVRAVAESHQARHARAAARRPRRALRRPLSGAALKPPEALKPLGRSVPMLGGHVRHHFTAARRVLDRQRGVRPADRGRPRDHPFHRAALGRLRRAVDPRRHRPARQDHPDLRPRRRASGSPSPTPSPARSSSSRPAPARPASSSATSRRS